VVTHIFHILIMVPLLDNSTLVFQVPNFNVFWSISIKFLIICIGHIIFDSLDYIRHITLIKICNVPRNTIKGVCIQNLWPWNVDLSTSHLRVALFLPHHLLGLGFWIFKVFAY